LLVADSVLLSSYDGINWSNFQNPHAGWTWLSFAYSRQKDILVLGGDGGNATTRTTFVATNDRCKSWTHGTVDWPSTFYSPLNLIMSTVKIVVSTDKNGEEYFIAFCSAEKSSGNNISNNIIAYISYDGVNWKFIKTLVRQNASRFGNAISLKLNNKYDDVLITDGVIDNNYSNAYKLTLDDDVLENNIYQNAQTTDVTDNDIFPAALSTMTSKPASIKTKGMVFCAD